MSPPDLIGAPPASFPNVLTKEQVEKVKLALAERRAKGTCPMCSNAGFTVHPYYGRVVLFGDVFGGQSPGGLGMPTVVTTCTRCGFVALHILGTLGFDVQKGVL